VKIFIAISGKRHGPFDLEAVNGGLSSGKVPVNGTLAWWEGQPDWIPIELVPGIRLPGTAAAPPPVPAVPPMPAVPPRPAAPHPPLSPGAAHLAAPTGDATGGLIPYKNSAALVAYYTGIFSLIPVIGIALAIVAIINGVLGLRRRKVHPQIKGSAHCWIGIVLGMLSLIGHALVVPLLGFR
jgi:hypothetical protein